MHSLSHVNKFHLRSKLSLAWRFLCSSGGATNVNKYERKTPHEHVLLRPGMYVGQVAPISIDTWVLNAETKRMERKTILYSPALLKIFDEILVNAADNRLRSEAQKVAMSRIDISVQKNSDNDLVISVLNDGLIIPLEVHPVEKIYIPDMIFGQLLTGSNFDDSQKSFTGGRHGFGAKLTNIFSKRFEVEIYDAATQKHYLQTWTDHMWQRTEPIVTTKYAAPYSFTKITFVPDLQLFHTSDISPVTIVEPQPAAKKRKSKKDSKKKMKTLEQETEVTPQPSTATVSDIMSIFERRAYDISACAAPVNVTYNGRLLPLASFRDYVQLFMPQDEEGNVLLAKTIRLNDTFEVSLIPSPSGYFEHMAFVNAVWTVKGGTHVNSVTSQAVKYIEEALAAHKLKTPPSPYIIKNSFMVFIKCLVENPSFDSQTKDALTTKASQFKAECEIPVKQLKQTLDGYQIVQAILENAKAKELAPKVSSRQKLMIPKLEDAHDAGTARSNQCTLILTEGDSAKALAVSGLEVVGRARYGVLPLKGKIHNVTGQTSARLTAAENDELSNICTAIGLDYRRQYSDPAELNTLRYGHVVVMTDQDTDGSHIKGLIINFFQKHWPALLKHDGFIQQFSTPLMKISNIPGHKHDNPLIFFSKPEYMEWLYTFKAERNPNELKNMKVKYYKGLGTSTAEEGREYFGNLDRHLKKFVHSPETQEAIAVAFDRNRVDDRKKWIIEKYNPDEFLDPSLPVIPYHEFIDKELIHFAHADNIRSLPSIVDGLKMSQRKVLYAAFKKEMKSEMKVIQLSGYVAEQTEYHHGDTALINCIVRMAQNFMGSNNIPLLLPLGQFGTRHQGGDDFASARYIYTKVSSIARKVFPAVDDILLERVEEDGHLVEPKYFLPVIPWLLVNGSRGVGTGWSTEIHSYNPLEIIKYTRMKIQGVVPLPELHPYVHGFKGTQAQSKRNSNQYSLCGVAKRISERVVEVTELPPYRWTDTYKQKMYQTCGKDSNPIYNIVENHTTDVVSFRFHAPSDHWDKVIKKRSGLKKELHLESKISITNMHAFNQDMLLKKYESVYSIIDEYYPIRLDGYVRRKEMLRRGYLVTELRASNKARFVSEIIMGEISVVKKTSSGHQSLSTSELSAILREREYASEEAIEQASVKGSLDLIDGKYTYLIDMSIRSLTSEMVDKLQQAAVDAAAMYKQLMDTTPEQMWLLDLDELEVEVKKLQSKE